MTWLLKCGNPATTKARAIVSGFRSTCVAAPRSIDVWSGHSGAPDGGRIGRGCEGKPGAELLGLHSLNKFCFVTKVFAAYQIGVVSVGYIAYEDPTAILTFFEHLHDSAVYSANSVAYLQERNIHLACSRLRTTHTDITRQRWALDKSRMTSSPTRSVTTPLECGR